VYSPTRAAPGGYKGRPSRLALESYVAVAYRVAPAGKWMDIGFGSGTLDDTSVRARGTEAEGIELTRERRDVARRTRRAARSTTRRSKLSICPPKSFAAVTLINVFSHLTSTPGP